MTMAMETMDNAGDAFVLTEQARSPSKPNYNPEEAEARLLKLFHELQEETDKAREERDQAS